MLSIASVTQRYGTVTALADLSLDIRRVDFFGLLGPNGAGKSTTMALIAGLRSPQAGTITFDGRPRAAALADGGFSLGLVPQHIAFYEDLSAEENLRIFGELQGLRRADLRARIDAALAAVQLGERRRDLVKTFSGGMQRRLNLVAALLHRPQLLLCDEPTVGIDPQSRQAIFTYLAQLNREGLTIVYSTHYLEEAERLCSRIGIIDHGRLHALGTVDELLARLPFDEEIRFPATAATAPLVAQLDAHGTLATADGMYRFRPHAHTRLSTFFALVEALALPGRLFTCQRPSLEAVFLHLTGSQPRDSRLVIALANILVPPPAACQPRPPAPTALAKACCHSS